MITPGPSGCQEILDWLYLEIQKTHPQMTQINTDEREKNERTM